VAVILPPRGFEAQRPALRDSQRLSYERGRASWRVARPPCFAEEMARGLRTVARSLANWATATEDLRAAYRVCCRHAAVCTLTRAAAKHMDDPFRGRTGRHLSVAGVGDRTWPRGSQ
jgi:hypothetical protein